MENERRARDSMVEQQLVRRGIRDAQVLSAMREVPREAFVPASIRDHAFDDSPLVIGEGQTISQPYIVALMLEAAALAPSHRVLEVGTGSGYAAAVAAALVAHVDTIERHASLADAARITLARLDVANVRVHVGDGTLGLASESPFDAILVAAGGARVPRTLRAQLAVGGRLVMPVGESRRSQRLVKMTRTAADAYEEETICDVCFVPLIGAYA